MIGSLEPSIVFLSGGALWFKKVSNKVTIGHWPENQHERDFII